MNKTFGGRYEVIEKIGSGGMAIVYKAKDSLLNRIVTIKVLREQFVTDEDFIRRFRREAQAAASLSHPNIVSIYDVGKDGDMEYIVMEYVEGRNLKEIIREYAPISTEQAIHLARQIGDAICHAHAHHIIHRDIKPHNILITSDGRAKVTDFGIARAVSAATVTHTGNIVGSVHYLSPEQAKGVQSNEQSDIYSLGIILYELLTGKVPYDGETAIAIALKHLQESAVSPRKLNPRISPELEQVIMRAIAKFPEQRYATATELLDDLEKVRTGQPLTMPNRSPYQNMAQDLEATQIHKAIVASSPLVEQGRQKEGKEAEGIPPKKKYDKKKMAIIGGISAAVILLLVVGIVMNNYLKVKIVKVPDLTNLTLTEAKDKIREAGLEFSEEKLVYEFNNDIEKDKVMRQDPKAESEVKEGRNVSLVLSSGVEKLKFPNVTYLYTKDNVTQYLKGLGFTGNITFEELPSSEPVGTVTGQDPAAYSEWGRDGKIRLVVSSGASTQPQNMPNLVGKSGTEANKTLIDVYKLKVLVESEDSTLYPKDAVIRTDPAPGEPVKAGDTVTIVVSRGSGPVAWFKGNMMIGVTNYGTLSLN